MSDDKATDVVGALARVMAELPAIGKDQAMTKEAGGYRYRGMEAITGAVQPLLARHGVVFAAKVLSREVHDLVINSRPWTDTHLEVVYQVYGPGGVDDFITVGPIWAQGRDNSDKGANKAMTQAFKYALLQTLCISDSKDDGDAASVESEATPELRPTVHAPGRLRQPPPRPQPEPAADPLAARYRALGLQPKAWFNEQRTALRIPQRTSPEFTADHHEQLVALMDAAEGIGREPAEVTDG